MVTPRSEFPQLSAKNHQELVTALLQWCLGNGLTMYPPNFEIHLANNAPVTLFPTPLRREAFEAAVAVQKPFNEAYANVVSERKWLELVVELLGEHDPEFTGKLVDTYRQSLVNGKPVQPVLLGLFRLDYMLDTQSQQVKQIEFNTVLVLFGGLSSKVGELHNYLNSQGFYDDDYSYEFYSNKDIPVSTSIDDLATGLAVSNGKYRELTLPSLQLVVLFIVQPQERNCFDQRHIEYSLLKRGIKLVRMTLEDVQTKVTVREDRLHVKSTMDEVSVVYFRAGYSPDEYVDQEWAARLTLEKNLAIKCPSLLTQLLGAKKVQQELTNPEVLAKFVSDSSHRDQLQESFVKIYPLDDSEEGQQAQKLALDPEQAKRFVLKPQREGGGNNIYKDDIPGFLNSLPKKEWEAYILMELINPQTYSNQIIRNSEVYHEEILLELGVFGTILFNEQLGEIYHNENAGFLLRLKFSSSNEGGVAAGFGCVDSVALVG